ncbi:hypothetical protein M405DRAFT_354730 [Rhizopogon salebrosus TDB-379]|nr:hypothetical protein M405DRAFT_354730 [Rhizopogon salebrosus TDB-379]
MSFFCRQIYGFFSDVPAIVRIDGSRARSSVSCSFLHDFNHGEVVESTSGPVRIPTVDGWYHSRQSFRPAYLDGCDVELGHDWLASVSPIYLAPQFLRPSQAEVDEFPLDHSWVLHPQEVVESVKPLVVSVVDDPHMNKVATQAGSSNTSQAGPSNVADVNFDYAPIVSHGEFNPRQRDRNPALRSLAIAHGILISDDDMSSDDLRQSITCHCVKRLAYNLGTI